VASQPASYLLSCVLAHLLGDTSGGNDGKRFVRDEEILRRVSDGGCEWCVDVCQQEKTCGLQSVPGPRSLRLRGNEQGLLSTAAGCCVSCLALARTLQVIKERPTDPRARFYFANTLRCVR
jgi:hypothetical protein